jgi:hypothetical protein
MQRLMVARRLPFDPHGSNTITTDRGVTTDGGGVALFTAAAAADQCHVAIKYATHKLPPPPPSSSSYRCALVRD